MLRIYYRRGDANSSMRPQLRRRDRAEKGPPATHARGPNLSSAVDGMTKPRSPRGAFQYLRPSQQFRQLDDVRRDPPRFVPRQSAHSHSSSGLVLFRRLGAQVAGVTTFEIVKHLSVMTELNKQAAMTV